LEQSLSQVSIDVADADAVAVAVAVIEVGEASVLGDYKLADGTSAGVAVAVEKAA